MTSATLGCEHWEDLKWYANVVQSMLLAFVAENTVYLNICLLANKPHFSIIYWGNLFCISDISVSYILPMFWTTWKANLGRFFSCDYSGLNWNVSLNYPPPPLCVVVIVSNDHNKNSIQFMDKAKDCYTNRPGAPLDTLHKHYSPGMDMDCVVPKIKLNSIVCYLHFLS